MSTRTKYTSAPVPDGVAEVTVKVTGEMMSREGVAFTADVIRGGNVVGTIENQGNGGGTWFHHHTIHDLKWWDALCVEYAELLADFAPGDEYMTAEQNRAFYKEHPGQAQEALADTLFEDAALYKELNRKRSVLIRTDRNNDAIQMYKGPWNDAMAIYFKGLPSGPIRERWVKNEGWEAI